MSKTPDDREIIVLFLQRNEDAISLTQKKHGKRILSVCRGILGNDQDAEECLNQVLYIAWGRIPPENPENLEAFLCFLARCHAIDEYRKRASGKRGGGKDELSYEELSDLLSDDDSVEREAETKELSKIIDFTSLFDVHSLVRLSVSRQSGAGTGLNGLVLFTLAAALLAAALTTGAYLSFAKIRLRKKGEKR